MNAAETGAKKLPEFLGKPAEHTTCLDSHELDEPSQEVQQTMVARPDFSPVLLTDCPEGLGDLGVVGDSEPRRGR